MKMIGVWRWIVAKSRSSPAFFATFSVVTVGTFSAAAVGLQSLTNPADGTPAALMREKELRRAGRPDGLVGAVRRFL